MIIKNVSIDLDETVMPFIPGYLIFRNGRHQTRWRSEHIIDYAFCNVFNNHPGDNTVDVVDYENSDWYWQCTKPFPGAVRTIQRLAREGYHLFGNTSRQWQASGVTLAFLKAHFKSLKYFTDFGFGNRYPLNTGESYVSKIEFCDRFGANLHIDDSLSEAFFMASLGMTVILFDYQGKTAWNQRDNLPPNIIRAKSWLEVYQTINRLTAGD